MPPSNSHSLRAHICPRTCLVVIRMNADQVVSQLLEDRPLFEASVHLPARGRIWVAVFTGPIPGQQVWRSTGLTDRAAALHLARKWEAHARDQRVKEARPKTTSHRVSRSGPHHGGAAVEFTQREVAQLLGMSERAVRNIEKRALAKLRAHPLLRRYWDEYLFNRSRVDEAWSAANHRSLNPAERAALVRLARSPEERAVVQRLLALQAD